MRILAAGGGGIGVGGRVGTGVGDGSGVAVGVDVGEGVRVGSGVVVLVAVVVRVLLRLLREWLRVRIRRMRVEKGRVRLVIERKVWLVRLLREGLCEPM